MAQYGMRERRKLKRYSTRLRVFNQETGELLGYAENFHTQGMMLMSKEPIPDKKEIHICFGIANEDTEQKKISLTTYKIWNSFTDTSPRLYCTGLFFSKPSNEALDKIKRLIEELSA